jgi:hypothetical protein
LVGWLARRERWQPSPGRAAGGTLLVLPSTMDIAYTYERYCFTSLPACCNRFVRL